MPEGPEVEVIRQGLFDSLLEKRIHKITLSDKKLRRPVALQDFHFLKGATIRNLQRHGKLLVCFTATNQGFWCRLGMAGKLLIQNNGEQLRPHSHVVFHFEHGKRLVYVDPRRFGEVVPFDSLPMLQKELHKLGPDPLLWTDAEKKAVAQSMGKTKRQIKVALLDQNLMAGVGNIYACEALFLAKLSPFRQAKSLSQTERVRLLNATEEVLKRAVHHGGTTFSDYEKPDGQKGDNFHHRIVFQRADEKCFSCEKHIQLKQQHGRSTFYCPTCQRCRR